MLASEHHDRSSRGEFARVPRQACEHCEYRDSRELISDKAVFSSLLFAAASGRECKTTTDIEASRLDVIRQWTESTIAGTTLCPPYLATLSCDVVICCDGTVESCERSLASVLEQDRVHCHVILAGAVPDKIAKTVETNAQVRILPSTDPATVWQQARLHMATLLTPFVLTMRAGEIVLPGTLFESLKQLIDEGRDASSVAIDSCVRRAIVRRATLVDLRQVSDEPLEELIHELSASDIANGKSLVYATARERRANSFENGSPHEASPACDIVLPFHGQLEYVEEALDGILQQDQVNIVIHLIDDASNCETSSFLRHWGAADSRIRTYRNTRNIGQFSTFNNVSAFAESEFIAVHDADDVSTEDRFSWSVESLRLSHSDFFAAGVETFRVRPSDTQAHPAQRYSRFPALKHVGYFAENPTIVMRLAAFVELGGFADFGDPLANRASLDTEFQARSFYAGATWAISRKVVLRYRVHESSATQDKLSGWGSPARTKANDLLNRRVQLYARGQFDPKSFGSLGRHFGVTVPFQ